MAMQRNGSGKEAERPPGTTSDDAWQGIKFYRGPVVIHDSPEIQRARALFEPLIQEVQEIRREHRLRREQLERQRRELEGRRG